MARARKERVTDPDRIEAQALSSLSQFQLRHLALECVGWPNKVRSESDEQIAVVALGIQARNGEQSQRLHHQCKTKTFVAAERQQGAASGRRWIPSRLAPGAERDAFRK